MGLLVLKVRLTRAFQSKNLTLGMLQVEGVEHQPIYTLENPLRETSVDSRIPAGEYTCRQYSGTKYKDVYEVCDVPGRSAILIHPGNTEADTLGCILLGLDATSNGVRRSLMALNTLRELIGGANFTLKIFDIQT